MVKFYVTFKMQNVIRQFCSLKSLLCYTFSKLLIKLNSSRKGLPFKLETVCLIGKAKFSLADNYLQIATK